MGKKRICISERDAADYLGVEPETLLEWRKTMQGPAFIKYPADIVVYLVDDLKMFLEGSKVNPLAEV